MNGASILKQTLKTGVVDVWEIDSIELGGLGEIGIVKMHSLTARNTFDGTPTSVAVPSNMVSAMREVGLLEVFNKESKPKTE